MFRVTENGYEYLMILEVQTRPERDMARRLLEYTAMQHREFGGPVYPVVLNLTGRLEEESYSFNCLDLRVVTFNYRAINLVDLPGAGLLQHGPVGIVPLVPLMRHEAPGEEVLAGCARRIAEAPPEWQADLYLGLAVFSSLRFAREVILKVIEVSKMEASPLFDGIREKWIGHGIQQGIRDTILDALQENLGFVPEGLEGRLRAIQDVATLRTLHRRAVRARTLEDFLRALGELAPEKN